MTTIDDGEACKPMSRDPYVTRAPTVLPTTEMVFNTLCRICIQCVYFMYKAYLDKERLCQLFQVTQPPARPTYRPPTTTTTLPTTTPFTHQDVTFDGNTYYRLSEEVYPLEGLNRQFENNVFQSTTNIQKYIYKQKII